MKTPGLIAVIAILTALLAACGDGNGDGAEPSERSAPPRGEAAGSAGPGEAEAAAVMIDSLFEAALAGVSEEPGCFAPPWPAGKPAACTVVGPLPKRGRAADEPPARGLFGPDGSVQAPEGSANLCFWIFREDTRTLHAPQRENVSLSLAQGYLPIPKARWAAGDGIEVQTELAALSPAAEEDGPSAEDAPLFLYRLRLFNSTGARRTVRAVLVVRPDRLDGSVTALPGLSVEGLDLLAGARIAARCPVAPQGLAEIPPLSPDHPPAAGCCFDIDLPAVSGEFAAATPAADLAFLLPAGKPASWPEKRDVLKRYALAHVAWAGREGLDTIGFRPPDTGLADTYRAALAQLILAAAPGGVGSAPFSSEPFRCLETSSAAMALTRAGQFDAARRLLAAFGRVIEAGGRIPCAVGADGEAAGPEMPEFNGRALSCLVDHFRFTQDRDWLASQAAVITSAAGYLDALVGGEPGRLPVPPGRGPDGGARPPRFTDGFWTLHGLEEAAFACRTLGLEDQALKFETTASCLADLLQTSVTGTMQSEKIYYIPAGPESAAAPLDPEELLSLGACAWPGSFVTHGDEWAKRSFEIYWERWFEPNQGGMATDRGFLAAGMELGPPLLAMRLWKHPELILDWHAKHTTLPGLHLWTEVLTDGAAGSMSLRAAAAYVTLMRSIFLMEAGDYVFIAPGVSLRWFDLRDAVSVEDAPTPFGRVSYRIVTRDFKTTIDFLDTDAVPPRGFMMNQFYPSESPSILVDEKPYAFSARDLLLIFPRGTKRIEIGW